MTGLLQAPGFAGGMRQGTRAMARATALPITSAGRFSPLGPRGIFHLVQHLK